MNNDLQVINGVIRNYLNLHVSTKLTLKTTFAELNTDSIDMVEIVMKLEDKFDIAINDDMLLNVKTIEDIQNVVNKIKMKGNI